MTQVLKILFLDVIWDIVYFPLWWYSQGLLGTLRWIGVKVLDLSRALGLSIWVTNIFTPMYGQHDFVGKLISFFVRLVQIFFRGIVLVIGSMWYLLLLGAWLAIPFFVVAQLIR